MYLFLIFHYENLPVQYREIFSEGKMKVSLENFDFFFKYFRSNHTLRVHIRTASLEPRR